MQEYFVVCNIVVNFLNHVLRLLYTSIKYSFMFLNVKKSNLKFYFRYLSTKIQNKNIAKI